MPAAAAQYVQETLRGGIESVLSFVGQTRGNFLPNIDPFFWAILRSLLSILPVNLFLQIAE